MKRILSIVMVAVALMAAAPNYVPVHGVLTDASGKAITTLVAVRFSLHDAQTAGAELWFETQNITPTDGVFTAYLGQSKTLDLATFKDHGDLWLEVKVGSDAAMARFQLGSAAYGAYAEWCGNVPNHSHAYADITGSVPAASLPAGMVVGAQSCTDANQKVKGVDAAGQLVCSAVNWAGIAGKPGGMLLGPQACSGTTTKMTGVDATGAVTCAADETASTGSGITGSGNVGQVPYFTATTSVGGSSIAVDGSGKVGIGTTTPGARLQVESVGDNGTGDAQLQVKNTAGKYLWQVRNAGNPTSRLVLEAYDSTGAQQIILDPGPGAESYFTTGMLGVGTKAPAEQLTVASAGNRTVGLNAPVTGTTPGGTISFSRPGDNVRQGVVGMAATGGTYGDEFVVYGGNGGNTEMRFIAGNTGSGRGGFGFYTDRTNGISPTSAFSNVRPTAEVMKITDTGAVGIGTPSPTSNLTVIGNADFGATSSATVQPPGGYGTLNFPRGQLMFSNTNVQNQMYLVSNGYVSPGSTWSYRNTGTAVTVGLDSGNFYVATAPSGAAGTNLDFANNVRLHVGNTGNVGIGTTSPSVKLDVRGTGNIALFEDGPAGRGVNLQTTATTSGVVGWNGTAFNDLEVRATSGVGSGIYLTTGGNVGIGTASPGTYKLRVVGGSAAVDTGQSWTTASDARLKQNITPLSNVLEKIENVRLVRYDARTESPSGAGKGRHMGVIAQELEREFPELVVTGDDGLKAVAYDKLSAVALQAAKDLKAENDALRGQVAQQAAETKALEARLAKLEALISNR